MEKCKKMAVGDIREVGTKCELFDEELQFSDEFQRYKMWDKISEMMGSLESERVKKVMLKVNRRDFCPDGVDPYEDVTHNIGYASTIQAPHTHAFSLYWALSQLKPDAKVLNIGCGSGYLCAAIYEFLKDNTNM